MRRIKATYGIGYVGAEHEEIFEFDDDVTEEEIENEIWDWATSNLDVNWEDESEENEDE